MSDPAVSLDAALKIFEIVSILGGGGIVVFKVGQMSQRFESASTLVTERFEAAITSQGERFDAVIAGQGQNIAALQADVRELNKLMTSVAVQNQRLDTHDHRLDMIEKVQDDLRRGEGRILPLDLGARAKPHGP